MAGENFWTSTNTSKLKRKAILMVTVVTMTNQPVGFNNALIDGSLLICSLSIHLRFHGKPTYSNAYKNPCSESQWLNTTQNFKHKPKQQPGWKANPFLFVLIKRASGFCMRNNALFSWKVLKKLQVFMAWCHHGLLQHLLSCMVENVFWSWERRRRGLGVGKDHNWVPSAFQQHKLEKCNNFNGKARDAKLLPG